MSAVRRSVTDNGVPVNAADTRNARLEAELETRLTRRRAAQGDTRLKSIEAVLHGETTDEQGEARVTENFNRSTSYQCSMCRHVFVEGDVVYRRRETTESNLWGRAWELASICDECVRTCMHPSWRANRHRPEPCAGGCGVLVSHWYPWSNITTCSRRCSEQAARERKRAKREPRACEVCGDSFTPNRADARYCSSACRQDAYRKRKELA